MIDKKWLKRVTEEHINSICKKPNISAEQHGLLNVLYGTLCLILEAEMSEEQNKANETPCCEQNKNYVSIKIDNPEYSGTDMKRTIIETKDFSEIHTILENNKFDIWDISTRKIPETLTDVYRVTGYNII